MRNKIAVGILVAFGSVMVLSVALRSQEEGELPKFSIQFHLKEIGVECIACHAEVLERPILPPKQVLPGKETCSECHDVEDKEQCGMCHRDPDRAVPFEDLRPTVKFTHNAHVEQRGLKCQSCHHGLEETDYATSAHLPRMERCIKCHDDRITSLDCAFCHQDLMELRPRSHGANWIDEHNEYVRSGDASCARCHTEAYCQDCHGAFKLVTARTVPRDHYAPAAPKSTVGGKTTVLQLVHDLNYRYTHPLDAKGKERTCATCHESATFCQECHSPGEGLSLSKPEWHGGPDWGAMAGGVGTGGGRHGQLARRDIEACAACHETQGDDPTCLLCHTDRTVGRGNDPKTHRAGYADEGDAGGTWHDDDGAVCFNCHLFRGPVGGEGFCGYCHRAK